MLDRPEGGTQPGEDRSVLGDLRTGYGCTFASDQAPR